MLAEFRGALLRGGGRLRFRAGRHGGGTGHGTSAFTELLLERLDGRGRLLAMEISETNIAELRRRLPHCTTIHDSAEHLPKYLKARRAKCIISGLAWGNMLPATQDRIFRAMLKSLTPSGQFVAFAYTHAIWFPTSRRSATNC